MPKPWTSLSLTKNNVGRALTAAQIKQLRPKVANLGQLVSDDGRKAMREILKLSDDAIQEVIDAVKPKGEDKSEKKDEKKEEKKAEPAAEKTTGPPVVEKKAEDDNATKDGDTPAPVQHKAAHEDKHLSAPATTVHATAKAAPTKEQVLSAPEQLHVAGGVQDLSMYPEAERVTTIASDKQRADGTGPFASGTMRITPAASIGPVMQQAGLATTTTGDSRAEIASGFNPVTGSDNVLPQNRDGDDGRLAFATTHPHDSTASFATGEQAGFTRSALPKGIKVVKIGSETVSKPDDTANTKGAIADAIKEAVDAIRGAGQDAATQGGDAGETINSLRPFLPIAGAEDVLPPAGSDELKKENLALFDYKPSQWPLGDEESNPLLLNNAINLGIRFSGKLWDLPSVHPGGTLDQGARPYESHADVSQGDIRRENAKRKARTMSGYAAAAQAAKRARSDYMFTVFNPATQGISDGVYNTILDSNPLASELDEEMADAQPQGLRLEQYPCPTHLSGLFHSGAQAASTGLQPALMQSLDYNPVVSRTGVTYRPI